MHVYTVKQWNDMKEREVFVSIEAFHAYLWLIFVGISDNWN